MSFCPGIIILQFLHCLRILRTEQTDTNAPNYSNNYNNNYNYIYIYNCNEGDVEAFCSICCRTKKTNPNCFCVKLRPRRPLRQQYRKKTEGKNAKNQSDDSHRRYGCSTGF